MVIIGKMSPGVKIASRKVRKGAKEEKIHDGLIYS